MAKDENEQVQVNPVIEFLRNKEYALLKLESEVKRLNGVLTPEFIRHTGAVVFGEKVLFNGRSYRIMKTDNKENMIVDPVPLESTPLERGDLVEVRGRMFKVTKVMDRGRMSLKEMQIGSYKAGTIKHGK